jgi:hypothetical protein
VESSDKLARWGFELDDTELSISSQSPFAASASDGLSQWTSNETQRWLTAYLSRLHVWVQAHFDTKHPAMYPRRIAYVVSCPVAWAITALGKNLRDSIRLVGIRHDLGSSISPKWVYSDVCMRCRMAFTEAIGSDRYVERFLRDRLSMASSKLNGDPFALAQQLIRSSSYESYKTSLGREGQLQYLPVALTVPTMAEGMEISEAGIFDSKITVPS